jgi:hypothetical protein
MGEKTIQEQAADAVEDVLDSGESVTAGAISVRKASLKDAYAVMTAEDDRQSRRNGRRPLFRGINLSGVA